MAEKNQKASERPSVLELGAATAVADESNAGLRTLDEDRALALLKRRDLPPETFEQLSQNSAVMHSRKVAFAVAVHPRAPRHLVLRLLRHFYTFELMRFTLHPWAAADLKHAADEQLIARLESVTLGERLALARRGSQAVAAALLLDKESRVSRTALENARLTEANVIRGIIRPKGPSAFVETVCHHPKWSVRREIRMALLRSPHTPLACALQFARDCRRHFCATFCMPRIYRSAPKLISFKI